ALLGSASREAARRLARNALIEAALGLLILLDVGALGISVPAAHDQVSWPLPITWGLEAVKAKPLWESAAATAAVLAGIGLVRAVFAALRGRPGIALGGVVALAGLALGGVALSERAVPTVYLNSPLPYSVASVAAGA